MKIAVIGTGVSGSVAARLLASQHEVTVFEANDTPGGHANTVDVELGGRRYPVDTGFMVFNRRTYRNFCRMLDLLGIDSQPSDMSFSVTSAHGGVEYQGSSVNGLFAQRRNLLRPAFYQMLSDIVRFNREGMRAAGDREFDEQLTVAEFLRRGRYGKPFIDQYLVPMTAAIWSSDPDCIFDFPARFLLGFFANHGLMQLRDRPQWLTIPGGSRNYLTALLAPLGDCIRLRSPVSSVSRDRDSVAVTCADAMPEFFDEVVFATHADQTLAMLADPTRAEREVLRCFPYQPNSAVLHTDTGMLPRRRRAWASWNYRTADGEQAAGVTYDLSRLQRLETPTPLLLSLNADPLIDPEYVIRSFNYAHPGYTVDSLQAQRRHTEISGRNRTHYCGAYWGFGFHEDGVNSALNVARQFGIGLEACTVASTKEPSRIAATSP